MNFLRTVSNAFYGRYLMTDRELPFEDALSFLKGIKPFIIDGIEVRPKRRGVPRELARYMECASERAISYVDDEFRPTPGHCCTVRHGVYSGEHEQQHYFDFAYCNTGLTYPTPETGKVKGPFKRAAITFRSFRGAGRHVKN